MQPLPSPARLLALRTALAVAACVLAVPALAQTTPAAPVEEPVIAVPGEYSEAARKAYSQGLKDVRDLIAAGKSDEALARLEPLLKERPREAQARFLRAVALADAGRRDEAIAALRDLVADYPELPEAHNNLAVLYAAKGSLALAREELDLALAARPDYAVAHENLGDVYVRLAVAQYERAGKLDPKNTTAPAKLRLAREIVPAAAAR